MLLSSSQQFGHAFLLKQKKPMIELMLKASICHKSQLPEKKTRKFDYEKRPWTWHTLFLDPRTKNKFDENTKIITIEGNIAAGKDDFGRRLANELGMHYIPDVDNDKELDRFYTNEYGYDYRALNPLLPERMRSCDWAMFHENPSRHSVIHLQHYLLKLRIYKYILALQHIFNTGQGVILNRSCFGERVFVEAMHNVGWLPQGYLRSDGLRFYDYKNIHIYKRNLAMLNLLKPHLTIYLDAPVEACLERVKNSPDPMIAESKAMVPEFFEEIERAYEDIVLPKLDNSGLVMKVDYPKRCTDEELMDIVDDITKLDFTYDPLDTHFAEWDWNYRKLWYAEKRHYYTSPWAITIFSKLYNPSYDIAGIGDSITGVDLALKKSLVSANIEPFGLFKSMTNDPKYNNFFKALFDYQTFSRQLYRAVQSEYR